MRKTTQLKNSSKSFEFFSESIRPIEMQLTQEEEFDHWPKDGHISKYFAIHIRLSLLKIMIKFPLNQSPSYKEYWTSS